MALFLAYVLGVIGFLGGLGFLNYPLARMTGRPASLGHEDEDPRGWTRYIGFCTDHKVVGLQYLIGIGFFIFFGGVNAMLIRFELLAAAAERLPGGPVPHPRRPPRHDDDGDDDERDPRPVRQLLRAADDRRPAPGLPAPRGAHVLAPDGRPA